MAIMAKSKAGRPGIYVESMNERAYKLCLLGLTDADLATAFGVSEATLNNWKSAHPEFLESLKRGKEIADANVVKGLYRRAIGYSHPEEKIFQYKGETIRAQTTKHDPPDTTACIFWLKNRQPARWRDKQEQQHSGTVRIIATSEDEDI
jgi:transcriptional regulator with XRE-family HTH domain